MKKIVMIVFCILSCISNVNAQDYNEYLSVARQHLAEGNIEKAQKVYSIYCRLTGSCDVSFERELATHTTAAVVGEDFIETVAGLNMKMVWVEGGEFLMGGTSEQGGDVHRDEKVIRRVKLSSYYIGECEVTQEQWAKIMGTSIPDDVRGPKGPDYPMYFVSWEGAQTFCQKLSLLTGRTYYLPTEAQWEYAARGGKNNDGSKYSGSWSIDAVAWYGGSNVHRVKNKRPNSLGLYDMSGNVQEWCSDWYDSNYNVNDTNNPTGPSSGVDLGLPSGPDRVLRGGSSNTHAAWCRVSARSSGPPRGRGTDCGFRVVVLP